MGNAAKGSLLVIQGVSVFHDNASRLRSSEMVQGGPERCGNDPKWRDEEDERSSGAQGEIAAHRVDVRRPLVAVSGGPEPVACAARHCLPLEAACSRRGES